MTTGTVQLHAVVEGLVQGVGFRYFVADLASQMGLTGWVRNTFDGNVALKAEGTREQLDQLVSWLHQGPRAAHVTNVRVEWGIATGEHSTFQVRSTV